MLPIKSCNQVVDKVLMLVLCSLTPRHPHSTCKVWTKAMFVPDCPTVASRLARVPMPITQTCSRGNTPRLGAELVSQWPANYIFRTCNFLHTLVYQHATFLE